MANEISRPNFGPGENFVIVCAKKTSNYPVNLVIKADFDGLIFFYQNGEFVGQQSISERFDPFVLNKKRIQATGKKKLHKGLFSKEYKNVTIFWLRYYSKIFHFAETVTTKKGYEGKYGFYLKVDLRFLDHEKFTTMLRETKIKTDMDKIIISTSVVEDIICDRVNGAMETILDDIRGHCYNPARLPDLNINNSVYDYLKSELLKIGLGADLHISGLPPVPEE